MAIQDLAVHVLEYRPPKPVMSSVGALTRRIACLVEVSTSDGIRGWGESWVNFPAWAAAERRATLLEGVRPLVLGLEESDIDAVHRRVLQSLLPVGRQWGAPGPIWQALSAVDQALWDIAGQRQGKPVWELLGGNGGKAPVYASGLGPDLDPVVVARHLERGIRHFKLKVGRGLEADRAQVAGLRRLVGSDATIWVDANQAWATVEEATESITAFAEYHVAVVEEPLAADDLEGMRQLAAVSPLPLAAGENLYGAAGFARWAERGAIRLIQPDVSKGGGITEARRICADVTERYGLPYAPHFLGGAVGLYASLHFFNATAGGVAVEFDTNPNPLRDALVNPPPVVRDGCLTLPDGPGWGIQIVPEVWARHAVRESVKCKPNPHD